MMTVSSLRWAGAVQGVMTSGVGFPRTRMMFGLVKPKTGLLIYPITETCVPIVVMKVLILDSRINVHTIIVQPLYVQIV